MESTNTIFLYNGQFSILAVLCSLPLIYFGGERLFGIGAICLLIVYVFHVSFNDTRSSVVCFIICVAIMQFFILYSIGPLLWQSLFNIIFLLVYNVFIVLTGGLGLIQFEAFRRDEVEFCVTIEYFLFLVYPPCCVFVLMWLISWTFGAYLAPYLIIILGFPMCHTFLHPKLKPSFTTKSDHVLGQPEKMLVLFNYAFSPCFVYFLVNFFNLLHYSAWISMLFCICVPLFLVTFLDTTDLRNMADIRNSQWQFFQIFTGCLSLILGDILVYIHSIIDGVNVLYLAIILACSTTLFVTVKYRYQKIVWSVACGLLLSSYLAWFTALPWNLISTVGNEIRMPFFAVELVLSILGILSVLALVVSISLRYRSYLNQILVLHTFGFVVLEVVMVDSEIYSPYLMIFTSIFVLYLVQRLHQVRRLNKTPAVICISLHSSKLLSMFTLLNWSSTIRTSSPTLGASSSTLGAWSAFLLACGGFLLSATLTTILLFEERKQLEQNRVIRFMGFLFASSVLLSSTFIPTLFSFLTHNNPSAADIVGIILIINGACFAKLAFLHSDDQVTRKQSILVLFIGVLFIVLQPYFNIFEIVSQVPRLIFREIFYDTWHVVFAEYIVLPWSMLVSLFIILVLCLKLLSVKEVSSFSLDIISVLIGAPLGLYIAHCLLPYPKLPSSVPSILYMVSTSITTRSFLLSFKALGVCTSVKVYVVFLLISVISMAGEMSLGIRVNILQNEVPPSVLYQPFLHFITIIQGQAQTDLQNTLEKKNFIYPSVSRNISLLLVFLCGVIFSPKHYYDILLVPVCGLLLMLKIKDFGVLKIENGKHVLNRVLFVGVLGSALFYRAVQQLPWSKWNFWNAVAFTLEISVVITSFLVYLIILSVLWHQSISPSEKLGLAVFAPAFTLMLFYGRTAAAQVLGFVGPVLAYNAFYYPSR